MNDNEFYDLKDKVQNLEVIMNQHIEADRILCEINEKLQHIREHAEVLEKICDMAEELINAINISVDNEDIYYIKQRLEPLILQYREME